MTDEEKKEEEQEEEEQEEAAEEEEDAPEEEAAEEEEAPRERAPRQEGDREMFPAKCADCGNDTEVPFKPDPSRPVYCRDCFMKRKPRFNRGGGGRGRDRY